MLPPLTHMYKRSLSAPCGVRVACPPGSPIWPLPASPAPSSPFAAFSPVSPIVPNPNPNSNPSPNAFAGPMAMAMARVQEGVAASYHEHHSPQAYQPPPQEEHGRPYARPHGQQFQTHARRDTISLPVQGWHGARGVARTDAPAGFGPGRADAQGFGLGRADAPEPPRHARARGAYTYPPPYVHAQGPGPGPGPRYGGAGAAQAWWDRARGGDSSVYMRAGAGAGADDDADDGWADGGAAFTEYAPVPPSPSPPASVASPYAAHAKAAPVDPAGAGVDPYVQPLPLSPASDGGGGAFRFADDEGGGDARFRFPSAAADEYRAPPAISSFSTLSGWAGDYGAFSPASASLAATSFSSPAFPLPTTFPAATTFPSASSMTFPAAGFGASSSGGGGSMGVSSGSAPGTPPLRTSGWYQPPGTYTRVRLSFCPLTHPLCLSSHMYPIPVPANRPGGSLLIKLRRASAHDKGMARSGDARSGDTPRVFVCNYCGGARCVIRASFGSRPACARTLLGFELYGARD
ncbi:hypothetical protein B0H10DRAFT_692287 [Mycena sp. CBHHK59/15]|nr:hypothetical protein B0H10DRAFT_692287 [Mycena sp. CBHHK59/15]